MVVSCGCINKRLSIPVGTILPMLIHNWQDRLDKVPSGFLPCLGQAVLKKDYFELYQYIQDNLFDQEYKGQDYFYIPCLIDRYIAAIDLKEAYLGKMQDSENIEHIHKGECKEGGEHTHKYTNFSTCTAHNGFGGSGFHAWGGGTRPVTKGEHSHVFDGDQLTSDGGAEEFQPNSNYVLYIIKY